MSEQQIRIKYNKYILHCTVHVCAPPHTVRVAAAHNMHAARNTIFGTEILERDRSLETFDVIGY